MKTVGILTAITLATTLAHADIYKIGGVSFDEANSVRSAAIVEGPLTLTDASSPRFGRYSETYVSSLDKQINEFQNFNRSLSVGRLMGRSSGSDLARHVSFPEPGKSNSGASALPNVNRCAIELTWVDHGLPNGQGDDFVIYETGSWEGFAVAVRKVGEVEFTDYRYQFPASYDTTHSVNAVTFDLSEFGLGEKDMIAAIRIRNLFNSKARSADKVDGASGKGWVVYPGDPRYKEAFQLRSRSGGSEFKEDQLGSDIIYAAGLHDIVQIKKQSGATTAKADETAAK